MKHIFIVVVFFLFASCNSQGKKQNGNNEINKLICYEYSLDQLKALYYIDKKENLNINLFNKTFDAIDIDSSISIYIDSALFMENLKKISSDNKSLLIKKANEWLDIKSALDFAIDNSEDLGYLEFFYNNLETKKIFTIYLKNVNQDWGSLSSSQQYEVYYQIINQIYFLDSKKKLILMSDFYNYMK